jgi:hypothetical protein
MGYAIGFCLAFVLLLAWGAKEDIALYVSRILYGQKSTEEVSPVPTTKKKPTQIFTPEEAEDSLRDESEDDQWERLTQEVWKQRRSRAYLMEPLEGEEPFS